MRLTINRLFILLVVCSLSVMACDDNSTGGDDDDEMIMPEVEVNTQATTNGNQVAVSNVTAEQDGWIVVHRSNSSNDGPMVPDIIGKSQVSAGENMNVTIQLEEGVADGEILWAMLHIDDGEIGEYEFDGQSGLDAPVTYQSEIVMTSFEIAQTNPKITVADQVNQGGIFEVNVEAAEDGWIVIHEANSSDNGPQVPEIIGKAAVSAGMNQDVQVMLNEDASVQAGDMLYPMLHFDTGTEGEYEFDGQSGLDNPVLDGTDIVVTSFTVQENNSSLSAMNQTVTDNSIIVDVESETDGWVVVHRSNEAGDGPMVPDIIGKAAISQGMNEDVQIMFDEGVAIEDGEQLWPMVHFDTGTEGEYEFDGQSGLDNPVMVDGNILLTSINVNGAIQSEIDASDQSVTDNTITIDEVMTESTGFVVLHRDTGEDAPVVPASIGHTQIQLGESSDLEIMLDEGVNLQSGDKVWAMLHTDTGTIGSYDFDGTEGSDDPPVFDAFEDIVMVQFTIQ